MSDGGENFVIASPATRRGEWLRWMYAVVLSAFVPYVLLRYGALNDTSFTQLVDRGQLYLSSLTIALGVLPIVLSAIARHEGPQRRDVRVLLIGSIALVMLMVTLTYIGSYVVSTEPESDRARIEQAEQLARAGGLIAMASTILVCGVLVAAARGVSITVVESSYADELAAARAGLSTAVAEANDSADSDKQASIAQLEPATKFETEQRKASRSSSAAFVVGIAVIAVVLGFGLEEWVGDETDRSLSTPDAVARIAVIGAAFYLAGQLFRRSSTLNLRAQEFQRAAIAMAVTDSLADLIAGTENAKLRAEFRRNVYEHHLKGPPATATDAEASSSFVSVVEAMNKLRGSP